MTELPRPPESIETERLLLRGPSVGDAQRLFESYVQDAAVTRFLSWRPHASLDDTKSYLETCAKRWETAPGAPYFIELKTRPGAAIGTIHLRLGAMRAGFGYVLSRHHWGQGVMTEALRALLDWSLAQPPIWRAWSMCDVENIASARVMEKAGMSFEGIIRRAIISPNISAEPRDCRLYAKVR